MPWRPDPLSATIAPNTALQAIEREWVVGKSHVWRKPDVHPRSAIQFNRKRDCLSFPGRYRPRAASKGLSSRQRRNRQKLKAFKAPASLAPTTSEPTSNWTRNPNEGRAAGYGHARA